MKRLQTSEKTRRTSFEKNGLLFLLSLVVMLTVCTLCGCGQIASDAPETDAKPFHVTFYANGGMVVSGSTEQDVESGNAAVAPIVENGSMILSWDKDFSSVTEDMVVSAVWTAKTYTVTFHADDGVLVSGELVQNVEEGKAATAPVVEKKHYTLSWDADFSSVTEDIEVNAVWEKSVMTSVEIAEYSSPRVVTIETDMSTGSGFFISDDGMIVTNFHVIKAATKISVKLADGSFYPVETVVDFDRRYDLAILKINMDNTPYFDLSNDIKLGEAVYAIGSSLGFLEGTFSGGSVSSTQRTIGLINYIQTDAAISHGNSGGPLVNEYGQVIGINAAGYEAGQNLNLSIRVQMLDELKKDKNYTISQYCEWYNKETSRSYSPTDGETYYYSLVNRFETVTGSKCLLSYDGNNEYEGYVDCCLVYQYAYSIPTLDKYTQYLGTVGFEYNADVSEENEYHYENVDDDIYIIISVNMSDNSILIWPFERSAWYS